MPAKGWNEVIAERLQGIVLVPKNMQLFLVRPSVRRFSSRTAITLLLTTCVSPVFAADNSSNEPTEIAMAPSSPVVSGWQLVDDFSPSANATLNSGDNIAEVAEIPQEVLQAIRRLEYYEQIEQDVDRIELKQKSGGFEGDGGLSITVDGDVESGARYGNGDPEKYNDEEIVLSSEEKALQLPPPVEKIIIPDAPSKVTVADASSSELGMQNISNNIASGPNLNSSAEQDPNDAQSKDNHSIISSNNKVEPVVGVVRNVNSQMEEVPLGGRVDIATNNSKAAPKFAQAQKQLDDAIAKTQKKIQQQKLRTAELQLKHDERKKERLRRENIIKSGNGGKNSPELYRFLYEEKNDIADVRKNVSPATKEMLGKITADSLPVGGEDFNLRSGVSVERGGVSRSILSASSRNPFAGVPAHTDNTLRADRKLNIEAVKDDEVEKNLFDYLKLAYEASRYNQLEVAVMYYNKALEKEPASRNALFGLGAVYQQLGQLNNARDAYADLLKHDPRHRGAINNFIILSSQEAPESAIATLSNLYRSNPEFSPLPAQIAMIFVQQKRYEDAAHYMAQAAMLDKGNAQYRYNLALIYDRMGYEREAGYLYKQLVDASVRGKKIPLSRQKLEERLDRIMLSQAEKGRGATYQE